MSRRCMLWSCSTEYTSTVLRRSLARYMAMSARCSSRDASSPCSGAMAMPALAVTARVRPSILIGRCISTLSSWTISTARSGSVTSDDDQGELVAAEPGHGGPAGDGPEQALGDLAQEAVADGVTERVVDVLEAVDVEQHDRHPAALAQRRRAARVRNNIRLGRPVSMSWVAWCDLLSTS